MRFLADENFPGEAVAQLTAAGHDVVWVRTEAPGMADAEVVAWAVRDDRIVLTFDEDSSASLHGGRACRRHGAREAHYRARRLGRALLGDRARPRSPAPAKKGQDCISFAKFIEKMRA